MPSKKNDIIDLQVQGLLEAQRLAPDLEMFAVACMGEWGGPGGLAAALKEDYDRSDSPNTRSQILRLVVDVIKTAAPKNKEKSIDEELKDPAILAAAMRQIQGMNSGK